MDSLFPGCLIATATVCVCVCVCVGESICLHIHTFLRVCVSLCPFATVYENLCLLLYNFAMLLLYPVFVCAFKRQVRLLFLASCLCFEMLCDRYPLWEHGEVSKVY